MLMVIVTGIGFAMQINFRSRRRRCSVRKGVLRNFAKFTGKHPCQSLFLNKIYKNTFFTEQPWATASKICEPLWFEPRVTMLFKRMATAE